MNMKNAIAIMLKCHDGVPRMHATPHVLSAFCFALCGHARLEILKHSELVHDRALADAIYTDANANAVERF